MSRSRHPLYRSILTIFLATVLFTVASWATEKKLHNFGVGRDGTHPQAGLVMDAAGNLYGTTFSGGSRQCGDGHGCGSVFELSPDGGGGWREKVLHRFLNNGIDGALPEGGLVLDADGDLYGTTTYGGDHGCGTVFELTPGENGRWEERKLHNFLCRTDGKMPRGNLVFDSVGNLYGTTAGGGNYLYGTVFEISPNGRGGWTEKKLHNFGLYDSDGINPPAGVIFDSNGNLYGTTLRGGTHDAGTVFELSPNPDGSWTERVIHNFNGSDGFIPQSGLVIDRYGNLYGTTESGGNHDGGTVFELSANGHGGWTERKLHNFPASDTDGWVLYGGLAIDAMGNLYGTTFTGGPNPCPNGGCGTVFELMPMEDGSWVENKLHNFSGYGDGFNPMSDVMVDSFGHVYGATYNGGREHCISDFGCGTIFEVTP